MSALLADTHEDVLLEAATKIGFTAVFNVSEGFEGDLDGDRRRGHVGGWRLRGLKWVQD